MRNTYPLSNISPSQNLSKWSFFEIMVLSSDEKKKADGEKQTKPNTQIHPNDHLKPEETYNQLGISVGD